MLKTFSLTWLGMSHRMTQTVECKQNKSGVHVTPLYCTYVLVGLFSVIHCSCRLVYCSCINILYPFSLPSIVELVLQHRDNHHNDRLYHGGHQGHSQYGWVPVWLKIYILELIIQLTCPGTVDNGGHQGRSQYGWVPVWLKMYTLIIQLACHNRQWWASTGNHYCYTNLMISVS